jgi:hypothetical protein
VESSKYQSAVVEDVPGERVAADSGVEPAARGVELDALGMELGTLQVRDAAVGIEQREPVDDGAGLVG